MRRYAVFTKAGRAPRLVCDRFVFSAFLFGPFWLLAHRSLGPGLASLGLYGLAGLCLHGAAGVAAGCALSVLIGLEGQWLRGRSLVRRGWRLAHVVVAQGADAACLRLFGEEPGLRERADA